MVHIAPRRAYQGSTKRLLALSAGGFAAADSSPRTSQSRVSMGSMTASISRPWAMWIGSTGARMLTTLLHTLEDDDKEIGLVTMCCGGGLGTGTLIQRI